MLSTISNCQYLKTQNKYMSKYCYQTFSFVNIRQKQAQKKMVSKPNLCIAVNMENNALFVHLILIFCTKYCKQRCTQMISMLKIDQESTYIFFAHLIDMISEHLTSIIILGATPVFICKMTIGCDDLLQMIIYPCSIIAFQTLK